MEAGLAKFLQMRTVGAEILGLGADASGSEVFGGADCRMVRSPTRACSLQDVVSFCFRKQEGVIGSLLCLNTDKLVEVIEP